MKNTPKFPCIPGFNFNYDIGRRNFHQPQHFARNRDVYYLADKPVDPEHTRYPATYAWGEIPPLPPWLTHDRQRLMFRAFFQESSHFGQKDAYSVRFVKISFFLEDGTIKISEPHIENCGFDQGVLVRRARIPLPDPVKYRYYDILDLNIGKEPEIFGRRYKIVDCDIFTRKFLNRMGIPVPDPIQIPCDPLNERKKKEKTPPPKNCYLLDNRGNYLKYGTSALRFYGYWDDRDSLDGYIHDLEVLYHLADGRMELIERKVERGGELPRRKLLVKKMKVPKFYEKLEPIGASDHVTLLNVLGENIHSRIYYPDHAYHECKPEDYYQECDLAIGAELNFFGRKVILTSVDDFTREYYRKKYGIDDFTPLERPDDPGSDAYGNRPWYIPPWNGFGSYEDSLANCFKAVPKRPKVITDKFYTYENQENNDQVLRFGAKMITDIPNYDTKRFMIMVYVMDQNVSIVEKAPKSTKSIVFLQKMPLRQPGQELFSSEPPKMFEPPHFYVGATLVLNGFKFHLDSADEFTLNYMEANPEMFPKADPELCLRKVKQNIGPHYTEFTAKYAPSTLGKDPPALEYTCFKEAMEKYVGCMTEHEIITLARHYAIRDTEPKCPREFARTLVHAELIKHCWHELDRLTEDIYEWDKKKTRHLSPNDIYILLKSNRVPIPVDLISLVIDCSKKNEKGEVNCDDLINILDIRLNPTTPTVPRSYHEMRWSDKFRPINYDCIDWCRFIKDLGLEEPEEKAD